MYSSISNLAYKPERLGLYLDQLITSFKTYARVHTLPGRLNDYFIIVDM